MARKSCNRRGAGRETLAQFDPLWQVLRPAERVNLVHEIVAASEYRPDPGDIALTFHYSAD